MKRRTPYIKIWQDLTIDKRRLDLYQKGVDLLTGRYFLFRLWPFTISELGEKNREMGPRKKLCIVNRKGRVERN